MNSRTNYSNFWFDRQTSLIDDLLADDTEDVKVKPKKDHIRPLYEQKYKQPDEVDWSYWDEKNLQTLCRKCHKEKTKGDMERLREFNEQK